MSTNKYNIQIYYSTFVTHEVIAINEEEAILKARNISPEISEIISNLDNWKEADTIVKISNNL